ncbi:MAG: tetratricopeptide repeat protein [Anaerolineales bacterium]
MKSIETYLPQDRLQALAANKPLPDLVNGSSVFADISGFTALTEKLARTLGARRGVEELSQRLNNVYDALIGEVERYGGSVISFAGDSIIAWFEGMGQSSALRAALCAQAMQSAMQAFDNLTMKVVITSGPVRRFAVGDPGVQLMDTLAGATVSRLATGEHMAGKKEILLDDATCAALGESLKISEWRTAEETQERFAVLNSPVPESEADIQEVLERESLPLEILRPWLLPTVYQRELNGLGAFLTELRPAVPFFLNFSGIDYDHDQEAEAKLNTFIAHAQHVIAKYEGTLLQLVIGDKGSYIYAAFGAPIAHEDDAQRAVFSALELRKAPEQFDFIQSIRIGISLGTLRVGAYGSSTRRTYAALGDDVNLAARLMMKAVSDEILITGRVQIEVGDDFALEPREPISIKGIAEPVPVFSVTGVSHRRATRLPEPSYRLPMIGRQEELALVEEKLELALQGQGQIIGITAEAGMGKSRLVAEVIRLARKCGFIGYGGACHSSGTNTPYLVWGPIWQAFFDLDMEMPLRKQMRLLEGEIEDRALARIEALPLLELVLNLPIPDNDFTRALEPQDRKGTLEALLEDCLKSAAQETPLLIVLEDLHWIDPLSHDLLESLARVSEHLPVCFVLAYRPPDLVRLKTPRVETLPYYTKIELSELGDSDMEQLIRAKLAQLFPERSGAIPQALTEELATKSQGNPFFIEELLNYLHDRGLDPYDAEALEALAIPTSLQTLILSRIDQLSEPQKVTLKVASVIGRLFLFSWLHGYYPSLGDEETIKNNLSELSRLDLTPLDTPEPEPAYLFKHIVTQEVAYRSLSLNTRKELHELLAKYLEATYPNDLPVEVLAFHYSHTDNQAKKSEYLRRSGDIAQAAFSNATALEYFKQALATSPDYKEAIDLHLKVGTILQMTGEWEAAKTHYQEALQIAEEHQCTGRMIECQVKLAAWLDLRGDYEMALEWLKKARALADQTNDMAGMCEVLSELGSVHWRLGQFDIARQFTGQSLDIARQIADKKKEQNALFFLATISGQQGNNAESRSYYEQTLAIALELQDKRRIATVMMNSGITYYFEGDYKTAKTLFEKGLSVYREIGDKRGINIALNNVGNIFYVKDDFQSARSYYAEALALAREAGDRYSLSLALSSLGITAFQQGKFDEANIFYQESLKVNQELGDKVGLSLVHCYLGLLALAQNQPGAAQAAFRAGLDIAYPSDIKMYTAYNLIGEACVLVAEDCPAQAVQLLSAATAYGQEVGFKIEPELQGPYDQALSSSKEKLSGQAFQGAWEIGQKMDVKSAIQLALEGFPSQ